MKKIQPVSSVLLQLKIDGLKLPVCRIELNDDSSIAIILSCEAQRSPGNPEEQVTFSLDFHLDCWYEILHQEFYGANRT